jgi:hypothetical protein
MYLKCQTPQPFKLLKPLLLLQAAANLADCSLQTKNPATAGFFVLKVYSKSEACGSISDGF